MEPKLVTNKSGRFIFRQDTRTFPVSSYVSSYFYEVLKILKTNISTNKLNNPVKSAHKFKDILQEALTKVYIKPSMITEKIL